MAGGKHILGKAKRHIFGTAKVGEKGQIVIPKDARQIFGVQVENDPWNAPWLSETLASCPMFPQPVFSAGRTTAENRTRPASVLKARRAQQAKTRSRFM